MEVLAVVVLFSSAALLLALRGQRGASTVPDLSREVPARRDRMAEALGKLAGPQRLDAVVASRDGRVGLGLTFADRSLLVVRQEDDGGPAPYHRFPLGRIVGADTLETVVPGSGGPRVLEVVLRVFLDDAGQPCIPLHLLGASTAPGSDDHEAARATAWHWEGLVRAVRHHAVRRSADDARLADVEARVRRGELEEADAERERARIRADRILSVRGGGSLRAGRRARNRPPEPA